MGNFIENTDNMPDVRACLPKTPWLIACLCAAWCDTCVAYRKQFDALQERHPDKCFAWIDIEDQAELVDAVDIENFPTILIQHGHQNLFFGTMLPDVSQLHRLIDSFDSTLNAAGENHATTKSSSLNQAAPADWSLRQLILEAG
jgi:thioredoxin 1